MPLSKVPMPHSLSTAVAAPGPGSHSRPLSVVSAIAEHCIVGLVASVPVRLASFLDK